MTPSHEVRNPAAHDGRFSRRTALGRAAGAGAAMAVAASLARSSVSQAQEGTPMTDATPASSAPTVVLVHGAFADASGWAGVITELQADGITVMAPANPLRGVSGDAAYIASVVNQIPGPVLLVGHSYGGVVITNAAPQAETSSAWSTSPHSSRTRARRCWRSPSRRPTACSARRCGRRSIRPATAASRATSSTSTRRRSTRSSAPTCRPSRRRSMAVSQRPGAEAGFGEPSGPAGWKTLPSWAVIAPGDVTIGVTGAAPHGRAGRRDHRRGRRLARRDDLPAARPSPT